MEKDYTVRRWGTVDGVADPGAFVEYLDTVGSLEAVRELKARSYELLCPREGHRLLEVGCGLGDDVQTLAARVGATGRVVGIDASEVMIAEARRRSRGLDLPLEFIVEDVQRTNFPDNSFDGCRAERLFVHLENPAVALAEMVRVAKPGAAIVVIDADWETLIVDSSQRMVTRKLFHFFCDSKESRWIGRQPRALFINTVLRRVDVFARVLSFSNFAMADRVFKLRETAAQARAAGVATESEVQTWLDELRHSDETGRFFAAVTLFCVSGSKA